MSERSESNVGLTDLLDGMTSREGNVVPAMDAPVRECMKGMCKTCVHCLDICKPFLKRTETINGYKRVTMCQGYAPTPPNA